jgi:hypothetical protein
MKSIFAQQPQGTAEMARASLVYSLVPYLGVLFVPFALLFGVFGLAGAYRRRAVFNMSMSVLVLVVQIFLWWLLYVVPLRPLAR